MTEQFPIDTETKSGCKMLSHLWKIAQQCNIDKPGIDGSVDRVMGFVQCSNVRDFMVMATLKCWEERGDLSIPPVIIRDEIHHHHNHRDNSKGQQGK